MPYRNRQLCSRRGRWRPQVRNKIDEGRVGFMPYGRNQRNVRGRGSTRHNFFVKSPKIFKRPAASRHNQYIRTRHGAPCGQTVKPCNCARHLRSAFITLNRDRPNKHFARETIPQSMQNITDHSARGRCNNADHLR